MVPPDNSRAREFGPRHVLKTWLRKRLADGRIEAGVIAAEVKITLHNRSTLLRAKKELGVISERDGWGPGSVWYWRLPDHSGDI